MGQIMLDKLRLVFMGTPDLAATILNSVLLWPGGELVAVYTQPDRPAGRGYALKASPVKELALAHNIPVLQPKNFKNQEDIDFLQGLKPDFLLVAAYGLILPQAVLDIPKYWPINVHTSLLPRYRGAAPIQRALMNADVVSGVTIMKMDAGLDTGPIITQRALGIGINEDAGMLHDQMATMGGELLIETLEKFKQGKATLQAQDNEKASYAAKLSKADGQINFNDTALKVHAHIRGVSPWPGAQASLVRDGEAPIQVNLSHGHIAENFSEKDIKAGTILGLREEGLAVACTDRVYIIKSLQPAGKKFIPAAAFFNGYLSKFNKYQLITKD